VRREVPSFAGRAPNTGKTPETITRVLQQLLADKKIPGKVEYSAAQDLAGHLLGHVFSVTGVKMPICALHFPGAENVSEAKLVETAKELSDTNYSNELVRGFAGLRLFALYREAGQLRAKFAAPIAKPDSSCKNGVDVTIPVAEGLIYSSGPTIWSGATALTTDRLNEILGMKEGNVANGLKFDQGIKAILKAYGREGYLDARVRPTPEFDDSAKKVTYKIDVSEGPQYRMGSLLFKGLAERDAKALRSSWTLRRGQVFDQGYLEEFFKNDSRSAMQLLSEERKALGKPVPRLEIKPNPNKQSLTVDVTLELAN
jgi:outer membrane protein assembly factor BamA